VACPGAKNPGHIRICKEVAVSYRVISQTRDGYRELVADTKDDLKEIMKVYEPVAMGTTVFVIATQQVFMLDGNNEWVELD
jgi:hypothetical protein